MADRTMADCLLGLGSNVGDRAAHLNQSVAQLCGHPQVHLQRISRYYETTPIGGPTGQGPFLNAAIRVTTQLSPDSLLAWTRSVEQALGRQRKRRWGPRVIDIDLLLYDQLICETTALVLPHPRMAVRRFVLQSANEIAADMIHAPTGWTLAKLLSRLDELPCYVAVAGVNSSARAELVAAASARTEALVLSCTAPVERVTAEQRVSLERLEGTTDVAWQRELDSLSQQRQLLSAIHTSLPPSPPLILGDFWLNQALAVASTWPLGTHRTQFEQACQAALREAPQPRFVLLLDVAAEEVSEHRTEIAPSGSGSSSETLAWALRQQAAKPGQAPILRVTDRDLELALAELLAAIDAMR